MPSAPENLRPLTTLRFGAALWVVGFDYWPDLTRSQMPHVLAKGYLGVELFFVLSGFILGHVYLASFGERRFRYSAFLWARLARIYPTHLATLAGMGALIAAAALLGLHVGDQFLIWRSLPAQLTLTQAWGLGPAGGWNHPSWSISAEWFAYLAFPLFAWVAWRLNARPRLAVVLALSLILALNLGFERLAGFALTRATIAWGALRIVPCFAYGCALYLLWRSTRAERRWLAVARAGLYLVGIVVTASVEAPDPLSVALFGGLIYSLAALPRSGSALLSSRIGVYLGEVSFAVYMVCIPWRMIVTRGAQKLLHLTEGPLPLVLWLFLFLGVTPVAMLTHHLVERPARSAMRAWKGFRVGVRRAKQSRALTPPTPAA
jgi:peptidoglycan/LPS O-acetylase OafA/YrhL